jgi:hypothetical protein
MAAGLPFGRQRAGEESDIAHCITGVGQNGWLARLCPARPHARAPMRVGVEHPSSPDLTLKEIADRCRVPTATARG